MSMKASCFNRARPKKLSLLLGLILLNAVPAWGQSLSLNPQWVTQPGKGEQITLSARGFRFQAFSEINIDAGEHIELKSAEHDPVKNTLVVTLDEIRPEARLGPRQLTFTGTAEQSGGLNIKTVVRKTFWVFSPGTVELNRPGGFPGTTAALKVIGKGSHFAPGKTRVVFRRRTGISVDRGKVEVKGPGELRADFRIGKDTPPGRYSFYVETVGAKNTVREMIFAEYGFQVYPPRK